MFSFQDQIGRVFVSDGTRVWVSQAMKKIQFIEELTKRGVPIPKEITNQVIPQKRIPPSGMPTKKPESSKRSTTKFPEGTVKNGKILRNGRWVGL